MGGDTSLLFIRGGVAVIEGLLEDKDAIVERIDGERAAIGPMREHSCEVEEMEALRTRVSQ
jgi:hypothetical protein